MEDTLRVSLFFACRLSVWVLILVLMEDTLRAMNAADNAADFAGLNPCFNGRYSQRALYVLITTSAKS